MFFAAAFSPPAESIRFNREVAPIFAMHCNGCHGEAGGLSLRSYRELMLGGNLGKVVIAGDAEGSLLVHFLDGRRGEARRMPPGGRPLSVAQMETIRRWIDEGAKPDDGPGAPRAYRRLEGVAVDARRVTQIQCRISTAAYLTVMVRDPGDGHILWSEIASVKTPKERNDAGEPGELLRWDIRAAPGWPAAVTVELVIEYAADGYEVEFKVSG